MFFVLLAVLVVFVIAFTIFLVINRKLTSNKFIELCKKKVERFAKRNNLLVISNLSIASNKNEKLAINQVVFGEKYIYLISNFMLKGSVSGELNNHSWIYFDSIKEKHLYINNLNALSDENIRDFSTILGISSDPIVFICVVPNECDFKIENLQKDKKIFIRYSSLNSKIKAYEKEKIGSLNKEQIYEQYRIIERRNKEGKR